MKTKIPTDEPTYRAFLQGECPYYPEECPRILTTRQRCINIPDFLILPTTVLRSSSVLPCYTHTGPDCIPFFVSYARRLRLVQNHIYHKTGRLHPVRRLLNQANALKYKDSPGELHSPGCLPAADLSFVQRSLQHPKWPRNPKVLR